MTCAFDPPHTFAVVSPTRGFHDEGVTHCFGEILCVRRRLDDAPGGHRCPDPFEGSAHDGFVLGINQRTGPRPHGDSSSFQLLQNRPGNVLVIERDHITSVGKRQDSVLVIVRPQGDVGHHLGGRFLSRRCQDPKVDSQCRRGCCAHARQLTSTDHAYARSIFGSHAPQSSRLRPASRSRHRWERIIACCAITPTRIVEFVEFVDLALDVLNVRNVIDGEVSVITC